MTSAAGRNNVVTAIAIASWNAVGLLELIDERSCIDISLHSLTDSLWPATGRCALQTSCTLAGHVPASICTEPDVHLQRPHAGSTSRTTWRTLSVRPGIGRSRARVLIARRSASYAGTDSCRRHYTGCGKKVAPKVFRCFLSNRLEF